MELIEKKESVNAEDIKKDLLDVIDYLADYEKSGLTSEQVMELSEAAKKLERYFGDNITVNQVIDFFVDFYVAQGDSNRIADAVLLTNEDASRYRELKERDTPKIPIYQVQGDERYEQKPPRRKAECTALDKLYCRDGECRFYKAAEDVAGHPKDEYDDTQNMSMAGKLIRAQGEQIRRVTAEEYLKDKMGSDADGHNKGAAPGIPE